MGQYVQTSVLASSPLKKRLPRGSYYGELWSILWAYPTGIDRLCATWYEERNQIIVEFRYCLCWIGWKFWATKFLVPFSSKRKFWTGNINPERTFSHYVKDDIWSLIQDPNHTPAIIYCQTIVKVTDLFAQLLRAIEQRGSDLKIAPYHASFSETHRSHVIKEFLKNKFDIVIATIALGMVSNNWVRRSNLQSRSPESRVGLPRGSVWNHPWRCCST